MQIPDRLSISPHSPYHDPRACQNIDVFIDGEKQNSVVEYCISQGWARRYKKGPDGKVAMLFGNLAIERVTGTIEVKAR